MKKNISISVKKDTDMSSNVGDYEIRVQIFVE